MDIDKTGLEQNSVSQTDASLNRLSRSKPPLPKKPPVSQKPANLAKSNKEETKQLPGKPSRAPPPLPKVPPIGHSTGDTDTNAPPQIVPPRKQLIRNVPHPHGDSIKSMQIAPNSDSNELVYSGSSECLHESNANESSNNLTSNHVTVTEQSCDRPNLDGSISVDYSKDNDNVKFSSPGGSNSLSPGKKVPPSTAPKPKLHKSPSKSSPSPQKTSSIDSKSSISKINSQESFKEPASQSTFYAPLEEPELPNTTCQNAIICNQTQNSPVATSNDQTVSPKTLNSQPNLNNAHSRSPPVIIASPKSSVVHDVGADLNIETNVNKESRENLTKCKNLQKSPKTPPKPPPKRSPSMGNAKKTVDNKNMVCDNFSSGNDKKLGEENVTLATDSYGKIKQNLENIISTNSKKSTKKEASDSRLSQGLQISKSLDTEKIEYRRTDQNLNLSDQRNSSSSESVSSPRTSGMPSPVPRTLKPSPKPRPKPRKRLSLNRQSGMDQSEDENRSSSCNSSEITFPVQVLPSGESTDAAATEKNIMVGNENLPQNNQDLSQIVGSVNCDQKSHFEGGEELKTQSSNLKDGTKSEVDATCDNIDSRAANLNSDTVKMCIEKNNNDIVSEPKFNSDENLCDAKNKSELPKSDATYVTEGENLEKIKSKEESVSSDKVKSVQSVSVKESEICTEKEKVAEDDESKVCSPKLRNAKKRIADSSENLNILSEADKNSSDERKSFNDDESSLSNEEKNLSEKSSSSEKFSLSVEEPPLTETSSLLDEIEQLVNKRMSALGNVDISSEPNMVKQMSLDSQMPVRPPRPKKEKKRSRSELHLQSQSLSVASSSTNSEIFIPPASSTKQCPPKPKRNRLSKVNRSHSDVSGMRSQCEREQNEDSDSSCHERSSGGVPSIPTRVIKSLNMQVPANQHEILKEMIASGLKNDSSGAKINNEIKSGKIPDSSTSPKLQNTRRNIRPSRRAPPPPPLGGKGPQSNKQTDKEAESGKKEITSQKNKGSFEKNSSFGESDHEYHEIDYSCVNSDAESGSSTLRSVKSVNGAIDTEKEKSPSPPVLPPRNSICSISPNDSLNSFETNDRGRPVSSLSTTSFISSHSESGSIGQGCPDHEDTSSSDSEEGETEEERLIRKKEKKVFFIAREICSSEKVFVDVLKLLNVDFRKHISDATEANGKPVLPNEILNKILNYLPQLHNFNEDLLKDLEERIIQWDEIKQVADIFVRKGPFLKLYISYIKDFSEMNEILDEACKRHEPFKIALRNFEMSPRCALLGLKHYMLKPIQRIPQYKLLLQDYLKQLTEDSPDYSNTITALTIVSEVADHANDSMRLGDDVQKLLEIQKSLDGNFEVIKPGRELLKKGELMKLSRKEMQPRMFFLFNDVLLYTTPTSSGGYRLNNVLTLVGMKVTQPQRDEFKNEINIISVQRSFTVQASTQEERDEWLKELQLAINDNAQKRNTFENVKNVNQSFYDMDYELGTKAPIWIPDTRVTMCMMCTSEFSVTWRRHHCRGCGRVVCSNCSENKAPLEYLRNKSKRVCDECFRKLKEIFEKKAKITKMSEPITQDQDGSLLSLGGLLQRFHRIRRSGRTGTKLNVHRPARLKEVHANDQGSSISGNLKTKNNKKWKKFWFVLKDKVLYTYKASEDMAAIDSMSVVGYEIGTYTENFEGVKACLLFKLYHKNRPPIVFQTDSHNITERWVAAMQEASKA